MYLYDLTSTKNTSLIVYHHIGLGDIVICNGMVNYISTLADTLYLAVDKKFENQAEYLYSENLNVKIISDIPSGINDLSNFVETFASENDLNILKIGWDAYSNRFLNPPFYKAFYKQLKLPYKYSYKFFEQPTYSDSENMLTRHLIDVYKIKPQKKIKLIHNEASDKIYSLNLDTNNGIFVTKDSDIFNNIFLYRDIAKKVNEIHCINSSFIHFIDRIETDADLYYHNVRGSKLRLKKNWKVINYES
ncbi:MAG: hypothetical protein CMB83_01015 [Flammeovirgaceae bacterium]|nr:hypothetical protein [Flammeovirgaceae bacterium]|tara:strand:+ start:5989 stop:6729 length:741 start_codon:yes stop_codon:yes gene_type:complete